MPSPRRLPKLSNDKFCLLVYQKINPLPNALQKSRYIV
ncbi:hypothetical protein AO385_0297 [Moraxella catarrhalis]|uniref:Uncharacterized protein n=1 Tax=Moraxella catarrhalis TaxID=480 RepID=A0A198UFD4_MORCA|nr:hypothetical protein AO384_1670 [Moraxella catarrhalis]OAU98959.1 hypothetical protein AO382_2225 [Moraxella catarrhalis]OAU99194.1 hypothetical protein AO383_0264 [Moraxella catarrhalis]OAV03911.1 hypothetical protein AO385_0297 [Moraxella catarrhalis]